MAFKKSDVFDVSNLKVNLDEIKDEETSKALINVVEIIKSGKCKIITFTGAGISTSAGIPDFRSKDGLYNILKDKLNIPNPELVFDLDYFENDPKPFYCVASKFMEEEYKPTIAHCFIKLLYDKGLLLRNFTQNVDGLDFQAGLPNEVNIEVHGHFRTGSCLSCHRKYTFDEMIVEMKGKEYIKCLDCQGVVKPDIIMFGESIPSVVFENLQIIPKANLIIIMGTSLSVVPFNRFISMASPDAICLVVNREKPDSMLFQNDSNTIMIETDCDSAAKKMCTLLKWEDDLDTIFNDCH